MAMPLVPWENPGNTAKIVAHYKSGSATGAIYKQTKHATKVLQAYVQSTVCSESMWRETPLESQCSKFNSRGHLEEEPLDSVSHD